MYGCIVPTLPLGHDLLFGVCVRLTNFTVCSHSGLRTSGCTTKCQLAQVTFSELDRAAIATVPLPSSACQEPLVGRGLACTLTTGFDVLHDHLQSEHVDNNSGVDVNDGHCGAGMRRGKWLFCMCADGHRNRRSSVGSSLSSSRHAQEKHTVPLALKYVLNVSQNWLSKFYVKAA